jgi:hypothetical protein
MRSQLSGVPVLCDTSVNFEGRGFFPDIDIASARGREPAILGATAGTNVRRYASEVV